MPTQQPQQPMYCAQQINVPAELPDILKQFTKAAIRTQPKDLTAWSAAYFRALANGETPPVKERIEFPEGKSTLTIGLLRVLNRQLSEHKTVSLSSLARRWDGLCLDTEQFNDLVQLGNFKKEVDWLKFLALACSSVAKDLVDSMQVFCEVCTEDPEGGAARVPYPVFAETLSYLAKKDKTVTKEKLDALLEFLVEQSDKQGGYVMPRNLQQADAPVLT